MTDKPIELTEEQKTVARYAGDQLIVKAFAGTGKTFTLIQYAKQNPTKRILYLAYNRAIRDEAVHKFPGNVDCKTSHQLAYWAIGQNYRPKLAPNLRLTDIVQRLPARDWFVARVLQDAIHQFLCSPDRDIAAHHVLMVNAPRQIDRFVIKARELWQCMINPDDPFPITHDGYLKLYQLSAPDLSHFDAILFDEAQDANPVTTDIVISQPCKLIFVGDPHQQIYRWRGANNSLNHPSMAQADILYLTHSFRFGPNVAAVANAILLHKNESRSVVGCGSDDFIVDRLPKKCRRTIIHRTVFNVIESGLRALKSNQNVYWVGGIQGYEVDLLKDIFWFSNDKPDRVRAKKLISDYRSFEEYKRVAKQTKDSEMLRAVSIVNKHPDLPSLIDQMIERSTEDESQADIVLTTGHRSKGLEWNTVELSNDFSWYDQETGETLDDELNLLYVSATRAMKYLKIDKNIADLLTIKKAVDSGFDIGKYYEQEKDTERNGASLKEKP